MKDWVIYYNPKCGTCRNALALLEKNKIKPRIVEYLKTPVAAAEIEDIFARTGGDPHAIVRAKEEEYGHMKLSSASSKKDVIAAIVEHPILLQRPIVLSPSGGVVARPAEKVEELF